MVVIGNCPVIFNIHYTPYKPKKGLPKWSVVKHAKERAFYDLSGEYNIYKYMTTEKLRFAMNETISKLKDRDTYRKLLYEDLFKHDIIRLAKEIPDNKFYGYKEMQPYRERIDKIVKGVLFCVETWKSYFMLKIG